jgi:hypothetical protein
MIPPWRILSKISHYVMEESRGPEKNGTAYHEKNLPIREGVEPDFTHCR